MNIPGTGRLKTTRPAVDCRGHERRDAFSCSLSAVMIARLHDHGGDAAVAELLRAADTAMFACKRAKRVSARV